MPVSEEIKRAFDAGTTILTANARAARWLHREYGLLQRGKGRQAWETPPIWDWDSWLQSQWEALTAFRADAPLLLSSLQERSIWERMLREDAKLLVSPGALATLAEEGFALLSEYEAHKARSAAWGTADAERFRKWAADFDRECTRRNWMPRAGLEARLAEGFDPKNLPKEILLVGFDRITPAQDRFLTALRGAGINVTVFGGRAGSATAEFAVASGSHDEIAACANWARSLLEGSPEMRIGVLVSDLHSKQAQIDRIFRQVLMPSAMNVGAKRIVPFEFSLGQPLSHVPMIRAALLLLRWLQEPLEEAELSWLLLSGFLLSDEAEYLQLARLDAARRDSGALSLEIAMDDFLKGAGAYHTTILRSLERARRTAGAARITDLQRFPGDWTGFVQRVLREAGWPGTSTRDSLYFQVMRRWERALDAIALLNFDGRRMKYEDFLKTLETHVQEVIFAKESEGAPVQIMGVIEASGQEFDAVWFLSADDESWPQRGRTHPLVPYDLQRRLRMPFANAEDDLALARAVTTRIAASAPRVVFSYSKRNANGESRPSPLLPGDAEWRSAGVESYEKAHRPADLEIIEEPSSGIAWPVAQSAGGSDVLKNQAACPFRSFATKRLNAAALNRREWGLSAAQRGTLLHDVLKRVWSPQGGALHSHDDLQAAIREGRLDAILVNAIEAAFTKYAGIDDQWMRAYLQNEQCRLKTRLEEWMHEEAKRAPFTVLACEQPLDAVNVGGLKLKLRADRIDEFGDAGRVLIDYKTGKVSEWDWEPPRPNEPQLPLYAIFGGVEKMCGVVFAQIRAGETVFKGRLANSSGPFFSDPDADAALTKHPYDERTRDKWNEALLLLADDFLSGAAAVDPKEGKATCQYCPLPGLCRVAEIPDLLDVDGDEDGSNGFA